MRRRAPGRWQTQAGTAATISVPRLLLFAWLAHLWAGTFAAPAAPAAPAAESLSHQPQGGTAHDQRHPQSQRVQPYIVLFRQRSGSSHLCNLLNAHPGVRCGGEELIDAPAVDEMKRTLTSLVGLPGATHAPHPDTAGQAAVHAGMGSDQTLDGHSPASSVMPALVSADFANGFKVTLHQAKYHSVLRSILHRLQFKVIFLYRRSLLRNAVSLLRAKQFDEKCKQGWHLSKGSDCRLGATRLDPDKLKSIINARMDNNQMDLQFLLRLHVPVLFVSYEDLLTEQEVVMASIFTFLGLEAAPEVLASSGKTKKISDEELGQIVTNMEELRQAFRNHPLAHELDGPATFWPAGQTYISQPFSAIHGVALTVAFLAGVGMAVVVLLLRRARGRRQRVTAGRPLHVGQTSTVA